MVSLSQRARLLAMKPSSPNPPDLSSEAAPKPYLSKIFQLFFWIGATSFGGGSVAYMEREILERRRWMPRRDFVAALQITQTLPGSNSVNMAVMTGRALRSWQGAAAALAGLLLPGLVILAALGALVVHCGDSLHLQAILLGTSAGAVGLLFQMAWKIGRPRAFRLPGIWLVAAAFVLVGIFRLSLPVTLILLAPFAITLSKAALRANTANTNSNPPPQPPHSTA
ncbi:MAG: chromate transporter [Terrimicrobiaceae bacterium]|nr:chromate transporter [Terrimicrobiaceae bacterium]